MVLMCKATKLITFKYYYNYNNTMGENKVYVEEAIQFAEESEVYRKVIEHRKKCKKWGKEFCLECFGGGLTNFTKKLNEELNKKKRK